MIVFGALHGLVFLPVLLSYIGECTNNSSTLRLMYFISGPFSQSLEDEISIHSSFVPSVNHRRGSISSTVARQSPFNKCMNDSVEFRGPNENTKLL